jgi:putative hemolysin
VAVSDGNWFTTFVWIVCASAIVAVIYAIQNDNCTRSGGHIHWSLMTYGGNGLCVTPDGRVVE